MDYQVLNNGIMYTIFFLDNNKIHKTYEYYKVQNYKNKNVFQIICIHLFYFYRGRVRIIFYPTPGNRFRWKTPEALDDKSDS